MMWAGSSADGSMSFKLKVSQKGMILVLVPVVFELVFVTILAMHLKSEIEQYNQVQQSKHAMVTMQRFYGCAMEAMQVISMSPEAISSESKARRLGELLNKMRNDQEWGQLYEGANPELVQLTKESEALRKRSVSLLEKTTRAHDGSPTDIRAIAKIAGTGSLLTLVEDSKDLNRRFLRLENEMVAEEPNAHQLKSDATRLIVGGMLFSTIFSILLLIFFTKDVVARLRASHSKAQLIAAGKPLPEPDSRDDEIGVLDRIITDAGQTLADAKKRESAIFDGTVHVMCSLDSKLRFLTVGQACERQWGYEAGELLGRSLLTLLPDTDLAHIRNCFDSLSESGHEGNVETRLRCADGTTKTMLWNIHWRKGVFYCVVHDVSELRNVEQLRQHFFSMASHDLRSPLTAVSMNISLITEGAKGRATPTMVAELTKVDEDLTQLMSLVNDILTLEKLEASAELAPSAVSAADVCESAMERAASLLTNRSITVKGPRGSALLLADEDKIEQAVFHVLSGVAKFLPPSSEITISIEKQDSMGRIIISQNSYRIPDEEANLIFDKFRQTRIEADRPVKRAGFGFAIAKSIVELHGGSIEVKTAPDEASAISMLIPLHAEESET